MPLLLANIFSCCAPDAVDDPGRDRSTSQALLVVLLWGPHAGPLLVFGYQGLQHERAEPKAPWLAQIAIATAFASEESARPPVAQTSSEVVVVVSAAIVVHFGL